MEGIDNKKNTYRFLVGKAEGKRPPIRPRHTWKTIVTHTIKKQDEIVWVALISSSGQRNVASPCEHDNKPLGSITCGEKFTSQGLCTNELAG